MNKKIAVLAGDGIGPEIVPAAIAVLEAIGKPRGHAFEFVPAAVGGKAIDDTDWPLPDETLHLAKTSDAVLLGAVGGPKWEGLEYERRPERALLGLRGTTRAVCESPACQTVFGIGRCLDPQARGHRGH